MFKVLTLAVATASAYEFSDRLNGTNWAISPNVTLGCSKAATLINSMSSIKDVIPPEIMSLIVYGLGELGPNLKANNTWTVDLVSSVQLSGNWSLGDDGLPVLQAEKVVPQMCELFNACNDVTVSSFVNCGFTAKVSGSVHGDSTQRITQSFAMTVDLQFPNIEGQATNNCVSVLGCADSTQNVQSVEQPLPAGITGAPTSPTSAPTTVAPTASPTKAPTESPTKAPTEPKASDAIHALPALAAMFLCAMV
jgi:hypothetical protein